MRTDEWLQARFEHIWGNFFNDLPPDHNIIIKFGAKARTRLGSIKLIESRGSTTQITITGFFKDEVIPEHVVDAVIGHELCHYAHGFFSPLPKFSKHPHKGGIVDKELVKRGMGDYLKLQKKWLKDNWRNYVMEHIEIKPRKARKKSVYLKRGLFRFLTG